MRIEEIIKNVGEKYKAAEPRCQERKLCNSVIIGDVELNYSKKRRLNNK